MKYITKKLHFNGVLKITFILIFQLIVQSAIAQSSILDKTLSVTFKNDHLNSALNKIKAKVNCTFSNQSVNNKTISPINKTYNNISLRELLNDLLVKNQIYYTISGNTIFIQKKIKKGELSGKITNKNGEPIPFVSVMLKNTSYGTSSDENGLFNFYAPQGEHILIASFIGYHNSYKNVTIHSEKKIKISIVLNESIQNLNEVVISASRTPEKLSEIPASISVLKQKKIQQISQYANVVSDLVANIPGTTTQTNRQQTRGQYLRGRNVLMLIDGIPQSSPLFVTGNMNLLNPSVIERIEVVKGATSIYGNGAGGGIINYITKNNKTAKKIESNTTIGSSISLVNAKHTSGSHFSQYFNGKVEKWDYVLGGTYKQFGIKRDANGEISSPRDGLGETQWYNAFAKIGYEIKPDFNVKMMYNFFSNNQKSELSPVIGVYGESPSTGRFGLEGAAPISRGVRHNHNLKFTINKNNIYKNTDLTASYYLQNFKTVYDSFAYFTDVSQGFIGGQSGVTTKQNGLRLNFNTNYEFLNHVNGNIVYGLDLLRNKTAQPMEDGRLFTPEMNMKNYAAYFQGKVKYNDLIIKAGSRYEIINIAVDDYSTIYRDNGETTGGGIAINGGELDYHAITFNFGLRYNALNYIKPYANFSQSFSVGELGRILRTTNDPNIITDNIEDTKAVVTNNFELGIEGNITNNMRYRGSYFTSLSKLGTNFVEKSEGVFELSRLPEKTFGFEFELNYRVSSKLNIDLSVSTIEGKMDNNNNSKFNDSEDDYISGLRISPTIFRSNINYNVNPKWAISLASTLTGKRDRFTENDGGGFSFGRAPVNSTFVTNLFTSYKLTKNTNLLVGIENLFNNDYYPIYSQYSGRSADYIKANGINCKVSLNVKL